MLLMAMVAVAAVAALVIVVVFGPHRSLDVLRAFGYSIKFFALLPFQLASALYAWSRGRETPELHLLLLTTLALLFAVPYLVLRFFGLFKDDDETGNGEVEKGQFVAIGEPVVLQTSWKEPPFAVTVLGKPERIEGDRERVRVPVRYTGIVHRWARSSASSHPALMRTSKNDAGERVVWEREYENQWEPEFEDPVLVEGGTYDGYLYFRAEESEEQKTVPRRRFVELTWLDDSETVITVDLRKIVEPAERIPFHDGVPERRLDKDGFNDRLRGLGSQWADLGDASAADIGDVIRVMAIPDAKEWWDVTVLGAPECVVEAMVRLPLRVSSRYRNARHFDEDLLQIGTTPDEFGVIGHLWTPQDFGREDGRPSDCLHGVELQRDETREGAVYFSPMGRGALKAPLTEAFSTLWYGVNYMEMPVSLSPDG